MISITLSSGKEYKVDTGTLTVGEWRGLRSALFSSEKDDAIISKCTGVPADEIPNLPLDDLRRLVGAIVKSASEPLDPNSLGASI